MTGVANGTRSAAATAAAPYDWEVAYRDDPRTLALHAAVDRILHTSFPAIAQRIRDAAPPVKKQESATAVPPAIKPEPTMPARLELDATAYLTESSSDVDSQAEIDPKEALREMEARAARGESPVPSSMNRSQTDGTRDVAMADADAPNGRTGNDAHDAENDEHDDNDDDEGEPTACVVCHKSDNEKEILLCDVCDAEYHLYCLHPPLAVVPPGNWYCPTCSPARPAAAAAPPAAASAAEPEAMDVDDEPLSAAVVRIKQEKARELARSASNGDMGEPEQSPSAATSVGIAQTFENDIEKSNELLVHVCNCDAVRCVDPTFRDFCPHMKRFLRSACWASHNEKWLSYRIATATAELFAYHSLHCGRAERGGCNVPLCDELRVEEYV